MSDDGSSLSEDERKPVVHVDCVTSLGVAFHELQLIRVERHLVASAAGPRGRGGPAGVTDPRNDTATAANRRLLLGDLHTDPDQRVLYRPMGFQPALVPHQVSRELSAVYWSYLSTVGKSVIGGVRGPVSSITCRGDQIISVVVNNSEESASVL